MSDILTDCLVDLDKMSPVETFLYSDKGQRMSN